MTSLAAAFRAEKRTFAALFFLALLSLFLFEDSLLLLFLFLTLFLSALLLPPIQKAKRRLEDRLSSYLFLEAFLRGIQDGKGIRKAYEDGLVHLMGHYEPIPFSALPEAPYDIHPFEKRFAFLLEADRKNEAYLLDVRTWLEEVCAERRGLHLFLVGERRRQDRTFFSLFFVLLLLSLLTLFFPSLAIRSGKGLVGLLSVVGLSLLLPSVLLESLWNLRRKIHA